MALILVVLLLAILLGVGGFAIHVLWWLAVAVAIVWLVGFLFGGANNGRWYGR